MMNFDASSIPPFLLAECDARLDEPAPSRGKEMLRNLIDSGADDFWTTGGARMPAMSRDLLEDSRRRRSLGLTRRCRDYGIAATVLLALAPFMLAIALLIRVDSPGPVLFRQRRLGLHGRPFWVLKYRTMVADAEARL